MRLVTCASRRVFREQRLPDGARGLIVMAAWGCGAVIMSLCGEGLRLAPRGAAILVVAACCDQANLGGSPLRFTAARAACRPTGQPLWYNYVVPTPLLKPGSPKAFCNTSPGTVLPRQTSYSLAKQTCVPRPTLMSNGPHGRFTVEALAFYCEAVNVRSPRPVTTRLARDPLFFGFVPLPRPAAAVAAGVVPCLQRPSGRRALYPAVWRAGARRCRSVRVKADTEW